MSTATITLEVDADAAQAYAAAPPDERGKIQNLLNLRLRELIIPLHGPGKEDTSFLAAEEKHSLKQVKLYTRGITLPLGAAGFGVVLVHGSHRKELSGGAQGCSNCRMDLLAAAEGLRALKARCQVTVFNSNSYLVSAFTLKWVQRWRDNGWLNSELKPVVNADLWTVLQELCTLHDVSFVLRPFDMKDSLYGRCHILARLAAQAVAAR